MKQIKLKIYPSLGDSYEVSISVPDVAATFSTVLEDWVDGWIEDNLKLVEDYEILYI